MIARRGGSRASAMTTKRLGTFAMVMALVFAVVVTLLTALEWDFLHDHGWGLIHQKSSSIAWPSGTADGKYGWAQVFNFALLGLAILGLAYGLRRAVRARARVAPALLALMGLCLLAASAKTDEGESPKTWHGYVHAIASLTLFALSIVTIPLVWRWLRREPGWGTEARVSAAAAVGAFVALAVNFVTGGSIPFLIYLIVLLGWIAVLGRRMAAPPSVLTS
jgi:hypothetical protein